MLSCLIIEIADCVLLSETRLPWAPSHTFAPHLALPNSYQLHDPCFSVLFISWLAKFLLVSLSQPVGR